MCRQVRRPSGKWWTVHLIEPCSLHFLMVFPSPLAAPHESSNARSELPFCSQRKGRRGWGCASGTGEVAVTQQLHNPVPSRTPSRSRGSTASDQWAPSVSQTLQASPGTRYQSTFSAHLLCELHSPGRHPAGRWAFLIWTWVCTPLQPPTLRSLSPGTLTW